MCDFWAAGPGSDVGCEAIEAPQTMWGRETPLLLQGWLFISRRSSEHKRMSTNA